MKGILEWWTASVGLLVAILMVISVCAGCLRDNIDYIGYIEEAPSGDGGPTDMHGDVVCTSIPLDDNWCLGGDMLCKPIGSTAGRVKCYVCACTVGLSGMRYCSQERWPGDNQGVTCGEQVWRMSTGLVCRSSEPPCRYGYDGGGQ
jgi:hypothetical protein